MIRHCSLTVKMLMAMALAGLTVWALMDAYQSSALQDIFSAKLAERFSRQAETQRIRFDRYIKRHHETVKLLIRNHGLQHHVAEPSWPPREPRRFTREPPPWLPPLSVIRSFVQPRFILLLDTGGSPREIYRAGNQPVPAFLLKPDKMLLELSHDQGFITRRGDRIYLVASASVHDDQGHNRATLMLATPLDEAFLIASQDAMLSDALVIALLADGQSKILVSSDRGLVPPGSSTAALGQRYMAIGQGFFDYGATDTLIELVSFISTAEVSQLTREVLGEDRRLLAFTALAFIAVFLLITYWLTRRLRAFTEHVVAFSHDIDSPAPPDKRGDELVILEDRFRHLVQAVKRKTAALEHQAMHDPLTGLPNRKLLHDRLHKELPRVARSGGSLVLIISDLNHFKEINDTLGHPIGDAILVQAATRLEGIFRQSDSIARLGGDEFGMLLPDTGLEQALALARRVVEQFRQPFIIEGQSLGVGISMGLVECPTHGNDPHQLLRFADVAMYNAKRTRSGFAVYQPQHDPHSIDRLALMNDFRDAIERQQLELFFQPKLRMSDAGIAGVEALLRWPHPGQGLVPPTRFIPLAERTGLIKPLTSWVLHEAVHQAAGWHRQGFSLGISINLSVHNLHDLHLLEEIEALLARTGFPPSALTLELTESDIMTDPARAGSILDRLHDMGIRLSVDDFGTGYSSLSYLKQLPVSEIKIDRSFVTDMSRASDDAAIVRATIELGHALGLQVVGEGVHDAATWCELQRLGCDVAQGFHIAKPLPAEQLVTWLRQYRQPAKQHPTV